MVALPLSSQRCPMLSMLVDSMQTKWCTCCESYITIITDLDKFLEPVLAQAQGHQH